MNFITNPQLDLAFDYVRNTDKNIFLTGKAGTGKTTFLHQIKKEAIKRMVVVAPTGVAAINAGGMTIHSFFQLPFGLIVPGQVADRSRQRRFSGKKINLIKSLDLVVIDEISMVRADVLDGIDEVLRRYRDFTQPFGGVQLLMIGDLHQLPPVVKQHEWDLLREHYQTSYFFGSLALKKTDPVCIQLTHIYRQSDSVFIDLLNKVRDNKIDRAVLETLNSRYKANFQPTEDEGYITLTSHNASAQQINAEKLTFIPGIPHHFKATITGDFPYHAFPTEELLEFKIGAQVMFVKNDISPEKLYFNGKIGKITRFDDGAIYVRCPDETEDILVFPSEWENTKYSLDEKSKEVKEETIGSFTQYPLKLAWAITIHKSQGLTFDRAIIDAQDAFAHGQVYVALSRCKSFEGIVLRSQIAYSSVKTDTVVKQYSEETERNAPDEAHLEQSKRDYQQSLLLGLFDFKKIKQSFSQLHRVFLEHQSSFQGDPLDALQNMAEEAHQTVFSLAEKFQPQLFSYFKQPELPADNEALQARLQKAGGYFSEQLGKKLFAAAKKIQIITDNSTVNKNAVEKLEHLQKEIFVKNACFVASSNNFSVQKYIRAKSDADIDFLAEKKNSSGTSSSFSIPQNTPHPQLFFQLLKWRRDLAEENGTELYSVLPTKSMLELVRHLPTSSASLKKIKGIGDYKVKLFGSDIISLIEKYCTEHKIETNLFTTDPNADVPANASKADTKAISFELFKSGKSIDEIAKERGFVRSTIEGHLGHYISLGELDIFNVLDRTKVDEIAAYFKEHKTTVSSEAKAHFGEKYSYAEIKMVLAYMKNIGGE